MSNNLSLIKIETLSLVVFLIVVANFILGVIFIWPVLVPPLSAIPPAIINILIMFFFFVYYLLLLLYAGYYIQALKEYFKGNEIKVITISSVIGLVALTLFSFWKLGTAATLGWLIPTIATIILGILLNYFNQKSKPFVSSAATLSK